jgi:hypothetical protein
MTQKMKIAITYPCVQTDSGRFGAGELVTCARLYKERGQELEYKSLIYNLCGHAWASCNLKEIYSLKFPAEISISDHRLSGHWCFFYV